MCMNVQMDSGRKIANVNGDILDIELRKGVGLTIGVWNWGIIIYELLLVKVGTGRWKSDPETDFSNLFCAIKIKTKIRITYPDPYSTDSSKYDEEEYEFKDESMSGKRNVNEIDRLLCLQKNNNSLSTDGNVTEESEGLFSHPSPSSVLEVCTPALPGNGIGNSIKEEDKVEPYQHDCTSALVGNGIGNAIIEEGSVYPILEEEQSVLDLWEVPIMSPSTQEFISRFGMSDFCGIDDIVAYPMPQDECEPPDESELTAEDIAWIDGVLNFENE
ncbi:hypothetical protein SO802_021139 [Lithocarpus litseifolius]|uniref:Uncharacterized protein n=1 Tax=Lithocarpus litseifolius TaxID=425828 RepID=A0AAW2CG30_9ROSI